MKENEIKVSDEMLAEYWFKSALDSLEVIKKTILFLNQTYNFNLYDDDEDLTPEKLNLKVSAKYTNVCTPLSYVAELFLKSIIISDAYLNDNDNFKRNDVVRQLMKNVKSQFKSNAHNLTALVEYINKNIDENFKIDLAQIYLNRRFHKKGSITSTMKPIPRITYATTIYENAFINSRYLCETNDMLVEHIDLVKLIDYVNTLRDCCFLQLIKIELSKNAAFKNYIKEYYNTREHGNDDVFYYEGRNVYHFTTDICNFVRARDYEIFDGKQNLDNAQLAAHDKVKKILMEFRKFYDNLYKLDSLLYNQIVNNSTQNIDDELAKILESDYDIDQTGIKLKK